MIIREITSDWNAEFRVPNHTYELNEKGYLIAYMKEGTDVWIKLKNKLPFYKTRRKFVTVKK